jgi:dCMP deaminase
MPSQTELDQKYLYMALAWSDLSKARRKKVGCLIVKNGGIISDGYNGMPSGFDNNCELHVDASSMLASRAYKLVTRQEVLHAESNAITKLAKSTQSSEGSTMYTTASPCVECAKLIIQSGIKRLVFKELYRDDKGVKLLKKAGIIVDQYEL